MKLSHLSKEADGYKGYESVISYAAETRPWCGSTHLRGEGSGHVPGGITGTKAAEWLVQPGWAKSPSPWAPLTIPAHTAFQQLSLVERGAGHHLSKSKSIPKFLQSK